MQRVCGYLGEMSKRCAWVGRGVCDLGCCSLLVVEAVDALFKDLVAQSKKADLYGHAHKCLSGRTYVYWPCV
jgi:hypothetical protein